MAGSNTAQVLVPGLMPEGDPQGQPPAVPSAAGGTEFVLEVTESGKKRAYRMLQENLRLGRSQDCDIILTDVNASRMHCILQRNGDELILLDNNTRNGTFVNGARVSGYVTLKSGDAVQISGVKIVFRRFVRKSQMALATAAAIKDPGLSAPVEMAPKRRGGGAGNTFNGVAMSQKRGIPRRVLIYGVIGLIILMAVMQDKKTDPSKITAEDIRKETVDTVLKKLQTKPGATPEQLDERSQVLLKATERIADETSKIALGIEAALLKDEMNKDLEALTKKKDFGQPNLNFKEKIGREHVFSGIREFNYRNYDRAEEHFKAALIVDPTLDVAKQYLVSASNRRRLMALEEYKVANRYFQGKMYAFARSKYESTLELLRKDAMANPGGEWGEISKNCRTYIELSRIGMGEQNYYGAKGP